MVFQGVFMINDTFIKFNDIEGELQNSTCKDNIELLRWEWTVGQMPSANLGSSGGTGKLAVEGLYFEHHIDKFSPKLLRHCLLGECIPEAVITIRKSGGSPLEYFRITLQNVIIIGVQPVGYRTMRAPREEVGLSFSRINMDYVIQSEKGIFMGLSSMGYDIEANIIT